MNTSGAMLLTGLLSVCCLNDTGSLAPRCCPGSLGPEAVAWLRERSRVLDGLRPGGNYSAAGPESEVSESTGVLNRLSLNGAHTEGFMWTGG